MLPIRSFARYAPRAVSRLTTSAIRRPAQPSLLLSVLKPTRRQYAAAFSTSSERRSKAAEEDDELVAKIESEIQMENDMSDSEGIPTSVKDYLENSPFELIDTPGQEDVVLTRQFGDETIRVTFSIADLNAMDPESDYQDRAMEDEDDVEGMNQADEKAASEDSNAADGEDEEPSFPVRVNVVIEKPGRGALAFETVAQDGMIVVDSIFHYADASHAHAKTAENAHQRQDLYAGPPFANLDEDLQAFLERHLDTRGINTALATFVPDYIDMKEQKEYMRWLNNVKGFIDA